MYAGNGQETYDSDHKREAVLLTGGASRRMGVDKATMLVDGKPVAARQADRLIQAGWSVTVLGREPIEGCNFVRDVESFAGPLAALSRFTPTCEFIFVLSCDVPLFTAAVAEQFVGEVGDHDAVVPVLNCRDQPLCALYRRAAWLSLPAALESGRVMDWVSRLNSRRVDLHGLVALGLRPEWVTGVNTPEELANLLAADSP